jgi:hypothetical protein
MIMPGTHVPMSRGVLRHVPLGFGPATAYEEVHRFHSAGPLTPRLDLPRLFAVAICIAMYHGRVTQNLVYHAL